jgi:hypothetical protein
MPLLSSDISDNVSISLQQAIMISNRENQVKYSDYSIDTFRMSLLCEFESGSSPSSPGKRPRSLELESSPNIYPKKYLLGCSTVECILETLAFAFQVAFQILSCVLPI